MKTFLLNIILCLGCIGCVSVQRSNSLSVYSPVSPLNNSLPEVALALKAGEISATQLVSAYLDRIKEIDRDGPKLQSVLTINPDALENARTIDAKREAGEVMGILHGIPILLKDNIESLDPMPTTAGAYALLNNITGRDSPLVAGLRDAGAIILGKANLSQWANYRSFRSMSGWSALGGQVRNPHILDRNPCGSSSGSAVAVAAALAVSAVGTETNGSIICPSTVNGVVGFKPTVGLVSQQHIVPISSSQDTAGPMTRTVQGAAMMLNAMATGGAKKDYVSLLDRDSLNGIRVGVLRFSQGTHPGIKQRFNEAITVITQAGAEVVEIEKFSPDDDNFLGDSVDILNYEFRSTLNRYLETSPASIEVRSLADLIEFNKKYKALELSLFDQSVFEEVEIMESGADAEPRYLFARSKVQRATREEGIDRLLKDYNVAVLISPSGPLASLVDPINGDVWPDWAGAGYLAAMAGYPHLTVPMGTVNGLPIGLSFIGGKDQDAQVLSYGYGYEQLTKLRVEPEYFETAQDIQEISEAMSSRNASR